MLCIMHENLFSFLCEAGVLFREGDEPLRNINSFLCEAGVKSDGFGSYVNSVFTLFAIILMPFFVT